MLCLVGTNMRKIYQQFKPLKKPCVHETTTYIIGIIIFFHVIENAIEIFYFILHPRKICSIQ